MWLLQNLLKGFMFFAIELFYLNSTLNFEILPVLVFQLDDYYKVDRLLTGITAQQKGTTARLNKTSLVSWEFHILNNFNHVSTIKIDSFHYMLS